MFGDCRPLSPCMSPPPITNGQPIPVYLHSNYVLLCSSNACLQPDLERPMQQSTEKERAPHTTNKLSSWDTDTAAKRHGVGYGPTPIYAGPSIPVKTGDSLATRWMGCLGDVGRSATAGWNSSLLPTWLPSPWTALGRTGCAQQGPAPSGRITSRLSGNVSLTARQCDTAAPRSRQAVSQRQACGT